MLKLTPIQIISLYIYYTILISLGIIYLLYAISIPKENISMKISSIAALWSGAIGASTYYIRKLYRDGLNNRFYTEKEASVLSIHTFVYFLFRPIFAAISSFIIVIGIKEGFFLLSASNANQLDQSHFFYLCIFISFFVGFNVAEMFTFFKRDKGVL